MSVILFIYKSNCNKSLRMLLWFVKFGKCKCKILTISKNVYVTNKQSFSNIRYIESLLKTTNSYKLITKILLLQFYTYHNSYLKNEEFLERKSGLIIELQAKILSSQLIIIHLKRLFPNKFVKFWNYLLWHYILQKMYEITERRVYLLGIKMKTFREKKWFN